MRILIDLNATATKERIMPDETKTAAATQIDAETAGIPTTEKHLSLAKEIEKFAGEVEADIDEAWYAFKAFVLAKIDPSAKAGDPVPLTTSAETPASETPSVPAAETPVKTLAVETPAAEMPEPETPATDTPAEIPAVGNQGETHPA